MTNPNPSIQEQIKQAAIKHVKETFPHYEGDDYEGSCKDDFEEGATFASTLYESRIQELEKVNDHLDEGCNERDKRIKELELSLLESQQTTFKQLERIQELEKEKGSIAHFAPYKPD